MIPVQFTITTDSSGNYDSTATGDFPSTKIPLLLYAVEWVDTNFDAGVDAVLSFTSISGEAKTLLTLTNADAEAWYYPQALVNDNTGTATTFYTPQVVNGALRLVVSSGGNAKTGKCLVYLIEV